MKEGTQNYGSLSKTEEGCGDTAGSRPTWFTLTKPRIASDGAEDVTYSGSKRALLNRWMKKVKVRGGDLEAFIGPTDHCVEAMLRQHGGLGLEYNSLDRNIIDTAVWHRRKTQLIKAKREGINESFNGGSQRAALQSSEDEGGFDHETVKLLETERERMEWALVVGIGFFMAIIGVIVSRTADNLLEWKLESALEWLERDGDESYWYYGLAQHVATSTILAMFAFIPVAIAPVSGGSGIAEAKATLNGVVIANCTAISTCCCKAVSVICSVAASLPAGLEGPMIFMGLSIGENANRLVPRNRPAFDLLRTDRHRIDFAAIGCAAGVAAAFRSPVSGVLFAMEEGSSFWSTSLTWRCFLSACVTVITMYAIMSKVLGNGSGFHVSNMAVFNGIDTNSSSNLALGDSDHPEFYLWEYGMFMLVGSFGGIIGGLFCSANRALALLRRRLSFNIVQKGIEVFVIAAVTATLIWVLPSFFSRCGDIEPRRLGHTYYKQFTCEEGEYNELATLLLNPLGAKGITLLFTEDDPDAFSMSTCIIAGMTHLVILCVAFGMSISAGIFIPLLFIGACLGRALALICNIFLDEAWNIDPRTYAIIGAAATLGGVVRVLISLTAIVTHTTSLSFFMTPVMLTTLVAQNVGNWVSDRPGIYDVILQLRGVPFLEEECPVVGRNANIRARNVMRKNVVTVCAEMLVKDLVGILRSNNDPDFPVVDKQDGSLVGKISRIDLLALLSQQKVLVSMGEDEVVLSYSELDEARPDPRHLPTGDEIGEHLSHDDELKYVYIAPYMQIAPMSIQGHGSAERAYEIFRSLGLRSILVVDKHSRPIGIITRHELALLEEIGENEHKVKQKKRSTLLYSQPHKDTQFE